MIWEILIAIAAGVIVIAVIMGSIINKKKGKRSCSCGDCSCCSHCKTACKNDKEI